MTFLIISICNNSNPTDKDVKIMQNQVNRNHINYYLIYNFLYTTNSLHLNLSVDKQFCLICTCFLHESYN